MAFRVKVQGLSRDLWIKGAEILVRSFNSGTARAGLRSEMVEDTRGGAAKVKC